MQAEETHNTLKFALRAKQIEVTAVRNEIMDQSSLIARYQQEIALLKGQLDIVMRERELGVTDAPAAQPMAPGLLGCGSRGSRASCPADYVWLAGLCAARSLGTCWEGLIRCSHPGIAAACRGWPAAA